MLFQESIELLKHNIRRLGGSQSKTTVIQFSHVRSGSTLIYNLLRECIDLQIVKRHQINSKDCSMHKTVVTYRNPLDSLTSRMNKHGDEPTDSNIKKHLKGLKFNGLDDVYKTFHHPNILKLRYEDFFKNYDVIFDEFEQYFQLKIPSDQRNSLKAKYSIEEMNKVANEYDHHQRYDELTKIHANHISSNKGLPNSAKDFFNPEQLDFIKSDLHKYLKKLNYMDS